MTHAQRRPPPRPPAPRRPRPPPPTRRRRPAGRRRPAAAAPPPAVAPGGLRSLFLGGGGGGGGGATGGFSLRAQLEVDDDDAPPATGAAADDAAGCSFNFGSAFASAPAARIGIAPTAAAIQAGGGDGAAAGVFAAPVQGFMRHASEEELRSNWRAGRSDARASYKKMHQDAMRQQRKDRERRQAPAVQHDGKFR